MPSNDRLLPNARQFDLHLSRRRKQIALWAVLFSAAFTCVFLVLGGNCIIPAGVIASICLLCLVWLQPRSVFYVMLVGACAVETFPLHMKDSTTDQIPLFWDVNTIVQTDFHLANFHGIALSFFEVLLVLAGLAWFIRGLYFERLHLNFGTLFPPICCYIVCVVGGILNGVATGGQFNIALFEVRAQIYFLIAYLMAVNTAKDHEMQFRILLWCSALTIGTKAILAIYRYYVTLKGVTIPEVGIGAHEESFFFDCFVLQFLVLKLADIQPKLRRVMFWLLPIVIAANLFNERRAATAALVIAIAAMLPLAAIAFPKRRKVISITAVVICVTMAVYLPAFWNSSSSIGQPARAIKSQFTPDPRDASSNAYRDAENMNLMLTMKNSPVIGYGYGKQYFIYVPMVDLTQDDPLLHYMPHNQILWTWMRLGTVGFFVFWIMICSILIQGCQLLRMHTQSDQVRAAALLAVLIIMIEMVFGLLDLQLTNVRNMLFCGLWVGMVAALTAMARASQPDAARSIDNRSQNAYPRWNLQNSEPKEH